jgi:magnesium chelatase subunit D
LNRSQVALITFGGDTAKIVLQPTRSLRLAQAKLEHLPTGGATPFADGLQQTWQLVRRQKIQHPHRQPVLVIISDGEANIPLQTGAPVLNELLQLSDRLRAENIAAIILDVADTPHHSATLRQLAVHLRARYYPITGLRAHHVLKAIDQLQRPRV